MKIDAALAPYCANLHNPAMCLPAIGWMCHPRWRRVLAGNRGKFHARPAAAIGRWADAPAVIGGRDLQSGGSWAAVDTRGRMAVVTNVRDPQVSRSGLSRGERVSGFLRGTATASAFADSLVSTAPTQAPFNLLLADADALEYLGNHPMQRRRLGPGVHGMSNGALAAPWPKTERLVAALSAWMHLPDAPLDVLWRALEDQTPVADAALPDTGIGLERERWLATAFIRGADYGTRASTLILVGHDGRGQIHERRFGPLGVATGADSLRFGHGDAT